MTILEGILVFLLYIIVGSYMSYKQHHSSTVIAVGDKEFATFFAFFLWPLWFIFMAIKKVIIDQW